MSASETTLLVAFVGLFAAILGGLIQSWSALNFEKSKFERQSKWDLYTQYFLVLGELSFSGEDTERHRNALSLMAQLRGRIGIVGSADVIKAVGDVFRYENLGSPEAQLAMARALEAMRKDVGQKSRDLRQPDFIQLMFGNRDSSV